MKVVIITQVMAPSRIPVFNLIARDPDIELVVLFAAESEPHRRWPTYKEEIEFHYEVLPEYFNFRQGSSWTHLSRGLIRKLRRYSPDLVIAGGWDQLTHLWAYLLRHLLKYKFVWWVESTERDARSGSTWKERMKTRFVEKADGILVPGRGSHDYVKRMNPRAVYVAPNVVDNRRFARPEEPSTSQDFKFIFIGRLHEDKGVDDLLTAWRHLPEESFRLVIVGDGPLDGLVRDAANRDPRIHFVGHVDRDELATLLRASDAFVFPSRSDPWGLVINEAMAAGLPVISTPAPGAVDDLVEDSVNGYIVPTRDPLALSEAMAELASSRERAQAMGRRSLEIIERYSPEAAARGFHDLAMSFQKSEH